MHKKPFHERYWWLPSVLLLIGSIINLVTILIRTL